MGRDLQLSGRDRVLIDDLVDDGGDVLPDKRPLSRGHFVKNDAKAEQIGAGVELQSFNLLRRHVVRSAQHLAAVSHAANGLRDAKIHDLRHILARDHDVGWLDIAMNHVALARVVKPSCHLLCDFYNLIAGKNALLSHERLQRLAFQILHRDVEQSIDFIRIVDRDDVGMVHRTGCLRFITEASQHFVVLHAGNIEPHGF